jgi:hypothetical protein
VVIPIFPNLPERFQRQRRRLRPQFLEQVEAVPEARGFTWFRKVLTDPHARAEEDSGKGFSGGGGLSIGVLLAG